MLRRLMDQERSDDVAIHGAVRDLAALPGITDARLVAPDAPGDRPDRTIVPPGTDRALQLTGRAGRASRGDPVRDAHRRRDRGSAHLPPPRPDPARSGPLRDRYDQPAGRVANRVARPLDVDRHRGRHADAVLGHLFTAIIADRGTTPRHGPGSDRIGVGLGLTLAEAIATRPVGELRIEHGAGGATIRISAPVWGTLGSRLATRTRRHRRGPARCCTQRGGRGVGRHGRLLVGAAQLSSSCSTCACAATAPTRHRRCPPGALRLSRAPGDRPGHPRRASAWRSNTAGSSGA